MQYTTHGLMTADDMRDHRDLYDLDAGKESGVDELKALLGKALEEAEDAVASFSGIEGEPGTLGVELADGRTFFISIEEA